MKTKLHQITTSVRHVTIPILLVALTATFGCHTQARKEQNKEFFTSGSREADQRASQRMAKEEQLQGSGEGAGEKNVKKAEKKSDSEGKGAQAEGKLSLFDRLGGEQGITAIVEDATPRLLQDPRVNFQRNGGSSGKFGLFHKQTAAWQATSENVAQFKKHLIQFLSLASGGPAHYEGRDMKSVHANMHVTNAEFDAAIGDFKASLDKLQIPNTEQKEFLSIIESTRPQIVTVR
jgi:hemoglobin